MKITETEANMYTVAEAAALLHMKERDFRDCFRELGIPSVRVGYRILIPIKAFEEWRRNQARKVVERL